jgi:hypothetical protein
MKRSGMTNTLRRLVRRFWVPRSEYDTAIATLKMAQGHIMSHHVCNIMDGLKPGGFCPVCHHPDGSEPEMDLIARVIHSANG